MLDTLEVIYRAANVQQAHLLKNLLADEGIEAQVSNSALQMAAGDLPYGGPIEPRLLVDPRNAARARQLALEFEQRMIEQDEASADAAPASIRWFKAVAMVMVYSVVWLIAYNFVSDGLRDTPYQAPAVALLLGLFVSTSGYLLVRPYWVSHDSDEGDDVESNSESESPTAWPRCPGCSRPRHTSCPVCQTAGANFTPAFDPVGPDDEVPETPDAPKSALVICPTCDEPFRPVYLARCEWCGYRFADGRELPAPPLFTSPFDDLNGRAWLVLGGILLTIAAMIALFGWIASQV